VTEVEPPPSTRTPKPSAPSLHVPEPGPLTASCDSAADAPSWISTIEVPPFSPATSVRGARIVVLRVPELVIDTCLSITTCSR
jgi:hypothetical protein